MTILPNAEKARIDAKQKLHSYCLNPEHPLGKHKARVFESALNVTQTDANALKALIFDGIQSTHCNIGDADEFGTR